MGREISKKTKDLQDKYRFPNILSLQTIKYKKVLCLNCGYYYKRKIETSKVCPRCNIQYKDKVLKLPYFTVKKWENTKKVYNKVKELILKFN